MTTTKLIVQNYIKFCNKNNIRVQTHQIYGVLWCLRKELELESESELKLRKGGIIADDMGMGKTIQMIATIFLNFRYQPKTLILLPPILLQQWYSEIFKILGHSSLVYYKKNKYLDALMKSPIVLTSYDTFLRSPELLDIHWDRVICDEAHRLRNPKTKLYKQIVLLRTTILWCITGTPIHNNTKDVVSLLALFSSSTTLHDKNMILRRTKTAENCVLPKKTEIQIMIPWTNQTEWKLAKDIHVSIHNIKEEESFWRKKNIHGLVTMIRAKQLCILPKLLQKPIVKIEIDEPDDLFPDDFKQITSQNTSCKLNAIVLHLLSRISNQKGKIIFCHFQLEMTKIREILHLNNKNVDAIWIGNWKEFLKRDILDKEKTPILILQIRAGCEGLNLQHEFSEVYFVSPNWNPTLEEQAIARCYRIGQQNDVFVFRFYMDNLNMEFCSEKKEKEKKMEIQKYHWIMHHIPEDIQLYIQSFHDSSSSYLKYSMDQYILTKQNEKREKITEFINKITI